MLLSAIQYFCCAVGGNGFLMVLRLMLADGNGLPKLRKLISQFIKIPISLSVHETSISLCIFNFLSNLCQLCQDFCAYITCRSCGDCSFRRFIKQESFQMQKTTNEPFLALNCKHSIKTLYITETIV